MTETAKTSVMTRIKEYFGYKSVAELSKDWKQLSEKDKEQLKAGVENGTLTY